MATLSVYLKRDTHEPEFVAELEVVDGFHCLECDEYTDETLDSPLYECAECGTKFIRENSATGSNHQCPDCRKFGTKLGDVACAVCEAGEVEPVEYILVDSEVVLLDDVAEKIAALVAS